MIHVYHDGTKHHFHRFARSLGYLDWASQPNPFRSFAGALEIPLAPRTSARHASSDNRYAAAIGDILRHALGLSAWKQLAGAHSPAGSGSEAPAPRWALRVNPSSGNLHPTEAYVIAGAAPGLGETAGVYHYAADRHALERRCAFDDVAWTKSASDEDRWLVALTSIHWREAWKYGERAFRYCQHDIGHAIASVRIAAALAGCSAALLPGWSHADIAALTGIDRDDDYLEAEREEPACLIDVRRAALDVGRPPFDVDCSALLDAVRAGSWTGHASQLSEDHTTWSFIDDIAAATRDPGRPASSIRPIPRIQRPDDPAARLPNRALVLQRRSAVAFDRASTIDAGVFFSMLTQAMPQAAPPWDALWWDARIHLAIFVHRVDGLAPGLYLLVRNASALARLGQACGRDFLWAPAHETLPLYVLAHGDCRAMARRLSCDQDIAADGFFSLAMLADFDASVREFGPSFYRHLFWESGLVGQILYLEAEAAGARATGIGCFYDDPVHEVLGIADHSFQSLYHFTVGVPVEDERLTTEPGYEWERSTSLSDNPNRPVIARAVDE